MFPYKCFLNKQKRFVHEDMSMVSRFKYSSVASCMAFQCVFLHLVAIHHLVEGISDLDVLLHLLMKQTIRIQEDSHPSEGNQGG